MSEFEEKEYMPTELISTCGFESDIYRFTNSLDWQKLLDKSSTEIENYKKALDRIRDADVEVMKSQKRVTRGLCENSIFKLKYRTLSFDSEVTKKYGLLQLNDILDKANVDSSLNNLQTHKCKAASSSSTELELETIRGKLVDRKPSERSDVPVRKNIAKLEHVKAIMIAEPKILEFRNFKLKKSYKKVVLLKNVSINLARFQLEGRPKNSKFSVFLEFMKSQKGTIAPGMSVKIIVIFRSDFFEQPEEDIVVRVQGGKRIVIPIRAYRDPPILQGVSTLYHSCFRSDSIITPSTESLNTTLVESEIWTGDEEVSQKIVTELSSSTESSEYQSSSNGKILATYFECGKCFIGELVIIPTTMRNAGENGKFFIMSEVDWSSMNIEDVANSNMVITPPFVVHPAYFILRNKEEITFHSYFFPSTYGMQVDKLFIISDNCSVQPVEIIGDGIMFEEKFILFNEPLKSEFLNQVCEDEFAKYCVELSIRKLEGRVHNLIEILNTSGMVLNYRWEQREMKADNKKSEEKNWEDLCLDDIIIYPRMGIFKPYSTTIFYIFGKTEKLVSDQYRTILQLCIEDIPLAAIPKRLNLRLRDSETKRRMCQVTVDIFLFDFEIRIPNVFSDSFGSTEKMMLDFDKSIQTEEEDYLVFSPVSEKQSERNKKLICCSETKCNACTDSMTSIKAIIVLQNQKSSQPIQCKLSKAEFNIAVLKPSRPLYVGIKETFILILRNISNHRMIFEWGEVSGKDKHKLNVFIDPSCGSICASSIEIIQVSCEAQEPGMVSSFSVPCYSAKLKNSLTLKIECVIESLNISFFFSLRNVEIWLPSEELICVKWNNKSDAIAPSRKIVRYSDILPREEREKSISEEFELSESKFDEDYLEAITIGNLSNEFLSQSASRALIPLQKRKSVPAKDPILQFFKLPLKVAEMRIFLIQNSTPLTSSFSISLRNFYSLEIQDAEFNGENWDQIKQPDSGIVLIMKPSRGELNPYEIKSIQIYAYADTWGDYEEEISLNIDGLPQFVFQVQVQVEDLPVSYPVCRNLVRKTPFLKFMKHDLNSKSRTLVIENTSLIPIIINWHSFLIKGDPFSKSMPFKVFTDIFTPFLAFDFSKKSDYCDIEKFLRTPLERYDSNQSFKELNRFDSLVLTPSYESNRSLSDLDTEKSLESISEINFNSETLEGTKSIEDSNNVEKVKWKQDEVEIEMSIIPDYGEVDNKIFSINPQELFIPPREKRSITLEFNSDATLNYSSKILCRALGFIRIPPELKQAKSLLRKDGLSLPPTIIELEVTNVRPYLSLLSSKSQKIFKCSANKFGHHLKQEITIQRKLLLKNENQETLDINFETSRPFHISSIITYCGTKLSSSICIQPGESIEVVIACSVTDKEIQEEIKENERHNDWLKTIIKSLLIKYYDEWIQ